MGIDDGRSIVFDRGSEPGVYQSVRERDLEEIVAEIHAARHRAEGVVVSLPAHEGPGGMYNGTTAAPFMETFAHECIDEGADVFVGHGPHVVRGIEVYDDAPIFYSVGNFTLHHHTIPKFPAETYLEKGLRYDAHISELGITSTVSDEDSWHSVLLVCSYDDGTLERIDLHPLDLGLDMPYPHKGNPMLARERAEDIISKLAERSARFGTEVDFRDGIGVISP